VGLAGWEITSPAGGIKLIATYEDGGLHFPTPHEMQVARAPGLDEGHPVWVDLWQNGEACAYCQSTANPLRVIVARLPDGDWHESLTAFATNPVMEKRVRSRLEKGIVGSLVVPTVISGKVSGCYFIWFRQHRPFRKEEIALTRAMVHLATLSHQLYRLMEESREVGTMSERNRLAREIHDTLAQGFTGVIMQLEAAKDAMQREDWTAVDAHVGRAGEQARVSLGDARRSVVALRPHSVPDGQFRSALKALMRRLTDGSEVQATFHIEGQERQLAQEWEDNLLRIAQEALHNTLKHAKAKTFRATLKYFNGRAEFNLADDGGGFEIGEPHDGYGLIGIRERVNAMKGSFSLQSVSGKGTEISIVLDLGSS
jgi:signal transduction histidine kinase